MCLQECAPQNSMVFFMLCVIIHLDKVSNVINGTDDIFFCIIFRLNDTIFKRGTCATFSVAEPGGLLRKQ